jgi:hypothetical protein
MFEPPSGKIPFFLRGLLYEKVFAVIFNEILALNAYFGHRTTQTSLAPHYRTLYPDRSFIAMRTPAFWGGSKNKAKQATTVKYFNSGVVS